MLRPIRWLAKRLYLLRMAITAWGLIRLNRVRRLAARKLRGVGAWLRRPDRWAHLVEELARFVDPDHAPIRTEIVRHRHDR